MHLFRKRQKINSNAQLNSERAFYQKYFWNKQQNDLLARCQSEIAKALGMQISDINNESYI